MQIRWRWCQVCGVKIGMWITYPQKSWMGCLHGVVPWVETKLSRDGTLAGQILQPFLLASTKIDTVKFRLGLMLNSGTSPRTYRRLPNLERPYNKFCLSHKMFENDPLWSIFCQPNFFFHFNPYPVFLGVPWDHHREWFMEKKSKIISGDVTVGT